MKEIIGENFRDFNTPGSMGIVTDTLYVRCFWPKLDMPVALFAEGSSGIKVQGPPTPRNVVFPEDTVALCISVDDGNFREGRRWRTSEIPTVIELFYIKSKATKEVEELQTVTAKVEVEAGLEADVSYQKPVLVTKEVDEYQELTTTQARNMVDAAKKVKI